MNTQYDGVITRFLRPDERLIQSSEIEMPLVIEAKDNHSLNFLHQFIQLNSEKIIADTAHYGAVLFRGFEVKTDADFEQTILSLPEFKGISEAFMAEEGRIHVDGLRYVLHTNAVYKTGGTLYLGGFHGENYYNPDVPTYISFCCFKPSDVGGETGIINTEKVYADLNAGLQQRLEAQSFFASKWLISDVLARYPVTVPELEKICAHFNLPIKGEGDNRFILMYKPSVFEHPITGKKALQINLLQLPTLNDELRECFVGDYQGDTWHWHRFFWRLPHWVFNTLAFFYIVTHSFFYSPKDSLAIFISKLKTKRAARFLDKNDCKTVADCFNPGDVKQLAGLMREYYCSCLWQQGDILFIDNRKVVHAGMPGSGSRLVRALIGNPLDVNYQHMVNGVFDGKVRTSETVGYYMARGSLEE